MENIYVNTKWKTHARTCVASIEYLTPFRLVVGTVWINKLLNCARFLRSPNKHVQPNWGDRFEIFSRFSTPQFYLYYWGKENAGFKRSIWLKCCEVTHPRAHASYANSACKKAQAKAVKPFFFNEVGVHSKFGRQCYATILKLSGWMDNLELWSIFVKINK